MLAFARKEHEDRRKADKRIYNAFERWPSAKNCVYEIELEEPDKAPVNRADPHKRAANFVSHTHR